MMDPRLTLQSPPRIWRPENPVAPPPPAEPPPTGKRGGLPDAARSHRAAVDALARLDQADAKGQQQLWAANDRLEAARDALASAQERAADATYTRLTGARPVPGQSLAKAEAWVAHAEAEIADLIRARQRIAEERRQVEWQLASRRGDLTVALAATIRESPEMGALADAYLDALKQLNAIRAAFRVLPHGALPRSVVGWDASNFADRLGAADEALADAWRAALAALERDPSATLPTPPGHGSRAAGPAGSDRQKHRPHSGCLTPFGQAGAPHACGS